jgi:hypothetical protein
LLLQSTPGGRVCTKNTPAGCGRTGSSLQFSPPIATMKDREVYYLPTTIKKNRKETLGEYRKDGKHDGGAA